MSTLLSEPLPQARPHVRHVGQEAPNPARSSSWPLLGALGLLLELPGMLLAALSHVGQDARSQPGALPGHSWVRNTLSPKPEPLRFSVER